jgi:hypothetical protein
LGLRKRWRLWIWWMKIVVRNFFMVI